VVNEECLLGQHRGVAKRVGRDQHADPDALGARGQATEQSPRLEVGSLGAAGLDEVVAEPGALQAQRLKELPPFHRLVPRHVLIGADAEAEFSSHSPPPQWTRLAPPVTSAASGATV